jgi:hypothetical protein
VIAIGARVQHVGARWKQAREAAHVGEELRDENGCTGAVRDYRVGGGMCDQRQRGQMSTSYGVR